MIQSFRGGNIPMLTKSTRNAIQLSWNSIHYTIHKRFVIQFILMLKMMFWWIKYRKHFSTFLLFFLSFFCSHKMDGIYFSWNTRQVYSWICMRFQTSYTQHKHNQRIPANTLNVNTMSMFIQWNVFAVISFGGMQFIFYIDVYKTRLCVQTENQIAIIQW